MSSILGIDLVAGLNETQSQEEINRAIERIQGSSKLDKLSVDLNVDEKVLKTIREFNREFKKLSEVAQQTGRSLDQALNTKDSSTGVDVREERLKEAISETEKLRKATQKQSADAVQGNKDEVRTVDELLKRYTLLNKKTVKRDESGKKVEERFEMGDRKGHHTATAYATPDGKLTRFQEVEDIAKQNREMEQLADERDKIRQRIRGQLDRVKSSGYGSQREIELFDKKIMSDDIGTLKELSSEVDAFNKSLPTEVRKDGIQKTINSMNRLYRAGSLTLPKSNLISNIQENLKGATTKREIDDVERSLQRLQETLRGRDRGFDRIERLRKEDVLPEEDLKQLTQARNRLGKAESPEQVTIITDQIKSLEQQSDEIKNSNRELERVVNERQKIFDKLDRMRLSGYGDDEKIDSFDAKIMSEDIDTLKELSREVDTYNRTLPTVAREDGIQQTIDSMNKLHKAGSLRLPDENMISDIQGNLTDATTKKELDDVEKSLQNLQQTLRGRDKGFEQLKKIEADDILPNSTIEEVKNRLEKAESPEQVTVVSGEIKALEQQNSDLKASNREAEQLAKQREAIYNKIAEVQQIEGADEGVVNLFKQQTANQNQTAESFTRLNNNIGQYSQSLGKANQTEVARQNIINQLANVERQYGADSQKIAQFRQQATQANIQQLRELKRNVDQYTGSLQRAQSIERDQRKFHEDVSLLSDQVGTRFMGGISPEHQNALRSIADRYKALTPDTKNLAQKQSQLKSEFRMVTAEIKRADQGIARFSRQIGSAMVRIPVYAAGMAAMYAPLRMFQSAIQQTIDIDSQMTVLERVSSGAIKMNDALESSIDIAGRLGNVISEVNEGLINFARQGYLGDELTAMTEYATLMSNVSDLNVDESASSLTAAMKGFNIEAEESIHVVNAMNEVNVNQPPCAVMYK